MLSLGPWVNALVVRIYRRLLVFFPPGFRREMGEEMRKAFSEGCRTARAKGGVGGMLGYAMRGYGDVVREGLGERRTVGRGKASTGLPFGRGGLEAFVQDVRFGLRTLRRRPVFTVVASLTLALGIGSATAIFSVVNGVLLKPLPYPRAEELVVLWNTNPERGQDLFRMGAPDVFEVRRSAEVLRDVSMVAGASASFTGEETAPLRVDGALVSEGIFRLLGVQPLHGRVFREEEHQGEHRVVILSHGLWTQRFGSDPGIVGRTVTMDGRSVQVVGVMPPVPLPLGGSTLELSGPDASAFWQPLDYTVDWVAEIGSHVLSVVARMDAGADITRVQEEVSAVAAALVSQGRAPVGQGILVRSLKDQVVGDIGRNLVVLLAAVGLLLLLACGNVANLLLARSRERERELSVRSAIGADRRRLIGQILTEATLLGVVGGALGLALAHWGSAAMVSQLPANLPRQSEITVDGTVLLFTLATVFLASVLAVLVPAIRITRADLVRGLKSGGRGGTVGPDRNRANRVIVAAQVSVATVLLFGAGLLFRSLKTLEEVDPGFRKEGVLTAQLMLPETRYGAWGDVTAFYDGVRDRIEGLPGVSNVALAMDHPLRNTWWNGIRFLDSPPPDPDQGPIAIFRPVSDGYFTTMGIPVREGRSFSSGDRFETHPVMVINESFEERFFSGRGALGQRVEFTVGSYLWGEEAPTVFEVVGVVGDVRFNGLREASEAAFYIPLHQFPYAAVRVMVRTSGDPSQLIRPMEEGIWAVDPDLPVTEVRTMDQLFAREVAQDRFNVLLLEVFALAALALAAAGIYGVLNLAVSQRRPEIGIRLALGAESSSVVAMVMKEAAVLGAVGVAVGLGLALILGRFLSSLLFQVPTHDTMVVMAVALTVSAVAVGSGLVPAVVAARTDPVKALKEE